MRTFYLSIASLVIILISTTAVIEGGESQNCACGPNSTYTHCGNACERNCGWHGAEPRGCTDRCAEPGCYCDDGYVRDLNGICVNIDSCCDGETEEFLECGPACPETCDNWQQPDPACSVKCVLGCFCLEGFIRRSDGKCVEPLECPRENCDPALGEVYTKCGAAFPKTCEEPKVTGFTKDCVEGCVCPEGQLRRKDGKCVAEKGACNVICGANEVYTACDRRCPKTCQTKDDKVVCTEPCREGCVCLDGYVRNEHGVCVPPKFCGKCGPNEIYYPASPLPCPAQTCSEYCYNVPPYGRPPTGCPARCGCRRGFVLSDDDHCCIWEE